jgi:hypothetical protein
MSERTLSELRKDIVAAALALGFCVLIVMVAQWI